MRPIGHIPDAEKARRFSDYLAANGMATDVDREADGRFLVWIVEEEHIDRARSALDEFMAAPDAAKFSGHDGSAERMQRSEAEGQAAYARRIRTRKSLVARTTAYSMGPLTFALIVACGMAAFYTHLGQDPEARRWFLIEDLANFGFLKAIREGSIWRLWGPIFLHFGFAHILFNSMWLFSLGSMIEARCGTRTLAGLVFLIGMLSNIAQRAAGSVNFGGMSGVVYGLIGYVWIRGKFDPASGVGLDAQSRMMSLIWLVVCMTGMVGPIANTAHFSGLILGMAWGWASARLSQRRPE